MCQLAKAVHGGKSNTKTLAHALPWLAGSYPLDWMDFMESGIFGLLMKNWIDSAKDIIVLWDSANLQILQVPRIGDSV